MSPRSVRLAALAVHVSIVVVVLASVAAAKPSAQYDPATGRVKFIDLENAWGLRLTSPDPNLIPAGANPHRLTSSSANTLMWEDFDAPFPAAFLAGDVVIPDTPASSLQFSYLFGLRSYISGTVVAVPEPATGGLAVASLMAAIAIGRRRSRSAHTPASPT